MKAEKHLRKVYLSQFYRKNRTAFLLAFLSTVLISLANLGITWLLQQMIDTASGLPNAYSLPQLLVMTLALLVLIAAIKTLNYFSKPRFLQRAMEQYKAYAFGKLTQKSIAAFQMEATSTYLSAFSNDAASIESNYLEVQFEILFNSVMMIGALAMMLWYSPLLTAVSVLLFLLPIVASLLAGERMKAAEARVSSRNQHFLATLSDSLQGFPLMKSFRAEASITRLFRESGAALEAEKCRKQKISILLNGLGGIASLCAQVGTFLAGIWLAQAGFSITPGMLLLFLDLTGNVIYPINNLPGYLARQRAALGLIDKLAQALEANIREEGSQIPPVLHKGIFLENLSFAYPDGPQVLQNITTHFEAGKAYAIVGASGSGKSTLLNLLMASHSTYTGSIRYDCHDLRTIHSQSLYDLVTMIQQNVFLFNDTIHNNITLYQSFPGDAVSQAVTQAELSALIQRQGADCFCGENGQNLSGGEKQRVAIARSLLRKAPVLLADEATSALDRETAFHVTDAILKLEGLTRIVVTHALDASLLGRYDEILVLKNGILTESGTFDTLLSRKGDFYDLYTTNT